VVVGYREDRRLDVLDDVDAGLREAATRSPE